MKKSLIVLVVIVAALGSVASADDFGTGANQFTIDFVTISGDASGANGTNISQYNSGTEGYREFTDPGGSYRMGVHEITDDQWQKYQAASGAPVTGTNMPIASKTWYDAAGFVNWLNEDTSHSVAYKFTNPADPSTIVLWESGDPGYDANNPYRNSDAHYFLPTEDEWVKAAYWNDNTSTLQTYANASGGDLVSGDPDPTKWNYLPSTGPKPWGVGSGGEELNGTYDMMGNVWEWMESPYGDTYDLAESVLRGGDGSCSSASGLASNYRSQNAPGDAFSIIGFRVASVPEPCSLGLLALGALAVLRRRSR